MTKAELRYSLAWQIAWGRYMNRYLKDANLQKYFDKHRRDFDGTKLQVAHILWKVDVQDAAAVKATIAKVRSVRETIVAGKSTFADAAQEHSSAPTKANGGDIGEIERHAPMSEEFAQAAFALDKDEISEPVTSPFGVHLIKCLKITPGQRTWQDARGELQQEVERYLFDWTVEQERPRTTVKINAVKGLSPPAK